MKPVNASHHETDLYNAIQNLALPGREVLELLPEGKGCADYLAFSFDEQYTSFMESMTSLPEPGKILSLQELDSALNAISGPENSELWTDTAFVNDECWDHIRSLAEKVMVEFGW